MKKYILCLVATIITAHLAMAALLSYRYWVVRDLSDVDVSISQVTKFQEQKIRAMQPGAIDTIFLGDSSLGNAINAKLFDRLTGTKSLNLALTGGHGQPGALVFLREVAARQPALKNVILFFSVDGMAWGLNPVGRFYMSPWPVEPWLSLSEQASLLHTYALRLTNGSEALSYLEKIIKGHAEIEVPASIYKNDYFVFREKIAVNSEPVRNYHLPKAVTPESTRYLGQIGVLCRELHLHCIYVQGPIMAELITGNAEEDRFFSAVSAAVNATGITLANDRPFLMSEKERGDTIFHLSHDSRDAFTARYAKLITPMLDVHSK